MWIRRPIVMSVKPSTTVRLYPLGPEHTLPMVFDVLFFAVIYGFWIIGLGRSGSFLSGFVILVAVLAFHALQMAFVSLRFDDTAITIVRPWRRNRRYAWSDI